MSTIENDGCVSNPVKKEVHIVGFAPSTREKAGYNQEGVEIWVLNEWYTCIPQATNITRWFELHQRQTVIESKRSPEYLKRLQEATIPIMMTQKYDDIPMSVAYPLDDYRKALKTDYFTNSISYMIAQAIVEGYTDIGVYGVDMAQDEEYSKERPSVEYFIGYAVAKGINVVIPPESDICKIPYFYGFEEESAHKIATTLDPKKNDLQQRINNADNIADESLEFIDFTLKKYMIDYPLAEKQALPPFIQQLLTSLWTYSQNVRAQKKERLFLVGANDMVSHLRKILCPFD